ncbi:hypothetical protein H696_02357 [Fonticula alba]|uniref:DNA 3'-5' helicase n=1 Tax=Fonticula alba TaxID=691883 RepID=A0A058ZAJ8_FONAL|nr:hypothetical protein H696_02357 [Fonticula alba]KCV71410.1 hypothetical protein H696_02357 [Fonticula alba]|eukprot:XP_009494533.1 hypothetical protein H696_02357 [Fonticula alba]
MLKSEPPLGRAENEHPPIDLTLSGPTAELEPRHPAPRSRSTRVQAAIDQLLATDRKAFSSLDPSTDRETQEKLLASLERQLASLQRRLDAVTQLGELILEDETLRRNTVVPHQDMDWSADTFPWSEEALKVLREVFGFSAFRPKQKEIINATMYGCHTFAVLPTAAGKSLCFQLPSLLRPGFTLVVSPLISLMEDQAASLNSRRIPAAVLSADVKGADARAMYASMAAGHFRLVYATPEGITKRKQFLSALEKAHRGGLIGGIAVDEAHCCSQWGHNFRPDYLTALALLRTQLPDVPVLALTATADSRVRTDVEELLRLDPQSVQRFHTSFRRRGLVYRVIDKAPKGDFASGMATIAEIALSPGLQGKSGIVYCLSRRDVELVAAALAERGVVCAPYHAHIEAAERSRVHTQWLANRIQVIVATVAFGLGIDKPDVRFVIHHSMSKSLEHYYQESGRAGRDGRGGQCILMYHPLDVFKPSTMVFSEKSGLSKLYEMARYCEDRTCADVCGRR